MEGRSVVEALARERLEILDVPGRLVREEADLDVAVPVDCEHGDFVGGRGRFRGGHPAVCRAGFRNSGVTAGVRQKCRSQDQTPTDSSLPLACHFSSRVPVGVPWHSPSGAC